MRNLKFS